MELIFLKMVNLMKEASKGVNKDGVNIGTPMETFIKANGKMI
jgi:hypothetical protein